MRKVTASEGLKRRARKTVAAGNIDKYGRSTGPKSTRTRSTGSFGDGTMAKRTAGAGNTQAKKRQKIDDVGDARIVWHKKKKRDGQNYSENGYTPVRRQVKRRRR